MPAKDSAYVAMKNVGTAANACSTTGQLPPSARPRGASGQRTRANAHAPKHIDGPIVPVLSIKKRWNEKRAWLGELPGNKMTPNANVPNTVIGMAHAAWRR